MSWLPLSFGLPMVLWGMLALPVIWWLLRLTPPKPQAELFPPLRILARVMRKEETPHQSPWWLTLLRLLMAALIIFALAEPVFNPRERVATDGPALALVIDNGWASAPDWDRRTATAERLIADASAADKPVVLAFTAEPPNVEIGPFDADTARERLAAAEPRPVPVDRPGVFARVAGAIAALPGATVAVLADGLAADGDADAYKALLATAGSLVWVSPEQLTLLAATGVENTPEAFVVNAVRAASDAGPRSAVVAAFDEQGRRIAEGSAQFGPGQASAAAEIRVPFELRNEFASVAIDGQEQAGAVRALDENSRRRRVGLLSQSEADQAQPLLSPLYYIRSALAPFADLIEPASGDLAEAIPQLLDQKPAMIVMADVGTIPDEARRALIEWVDDGGTLVRFAGSRLAAAGNDEELLPVRLRLGERALGGSLSWTEPQPIAAFPTTGPFAGLPAPAEVSVTRQVLAEPTPDLAERTWASLADGTPLVTGTSRGEGTLALFHVTPEATWSNLPISGSFVEMLRRIVQLSRNAGVVEANGQGGARALPPYRMIAANGALAPPTPDARPLEIVAGAMPPITIEHPPGLYGGEEGVVARNLLPADATLTPLARPQTPLPVTELAYTVDEQVNLKGGLVAAALLLMILDTLAVFWMGGLFSRRGLRRPATASAAALVFVVAGLLGHADRAIAQEQQAAPAPPAAAQVSEADAIDAISKTRIAYVLTGNGQIDSISRAGLTGLSAFLIEKTALEPAEPAGVDVERDELAFYPLIYWPIDPDGRMPSEAAIARVDAYMQAGGTVLFDTRDQYGSNLDPNSSPANQRLRDILENLNVPPLEPVPEDHVLTKSFFIMPEFPGRYAGSPLWVEASLDATSRSDRPVRTGDGVTPIMITGNDLAGAWAVDSSGQPLLPTVPNDPMQRTYAYRAGVNIMMYMLTGNYKSDQVHVPVLLERLGQ